jgi:hypothetical protein
MGCALLWNEEKEEQEDWAGGGIQPKGFGGEKETLLYFQDLL